MEQFLIQQGYEVQGLIAESKDKTQWFTIQDDKLILPSMYDLMNDPSLLNYIEAKVYWFLNLLNTLQFDSITYEVVTSQTLLNQSIKSQSIAVDIETKHADWNDNALICVGFCLDGNPKTYIIPEAETNKPYFQQLFQLPIKYIWHNGLFDLAMLYHLTGVEATLTDDTMLQHYALIDETPGHQKLKDLSQLYLNAPKWDDELKLIRKQYAKLNHVKLADAHFDLIPTDTLFQYNAYDTYCTWWLHHTFTEIGDQDCQALYQTLCKAAPVYARISQKGMLVDYVYLDQYEQQLLSQRDKAAQTAQLEWQKAYTNQTNALESAVEIEPVPLNLNSPVQLKDALTLMYPELEITSTAKDALFDLPESPFLDSLREYKKLTKLINTYIEGVKGATSPIDGRCRSGFKLTGTATGRLSSGADSDAQSKFNYQNIARDKKIKRIFKARPGFTLLQFDMSGCELRVMAALSKDPDMCKIFKEDRDLHGEVAQSIWGDEYTKDNRSCAKTLNFGIAYGMGPQALQRRLHMMGIDISMSEAQKMQAEWKKKFRRVSFWLDQESLNGMKGITPQTIFGRKRRFVIKRGEEWKVKNEARNFKIQSTSSDLVLHALMRIDEELNSLNLKEDAYIVNTVHDSIVFEVRDEIALIEHVISIAKKHMELIATEELNNVVPLKADTEMGYTYAMD